METSARIALALALIALVAACRKPADVPRADGSAAPQEARTRPQRIPIYDEEGVRLPQEALPLGTPVPVGLSESSSGKGWIRYSGAVRPDEIIAFYGKYLTLPEGTAPHEVGNSTRFRDARPRQPGNPGRPVEVRVISEQRGTRTGLMIFDLTTIKKAEEKNWEEVPVVDPRKWKPSEPGEKVPSELL
jgi:hypothetical protein